MSFDLARLGRASDPHFFRYDAGRAIAYALACGATAEELDLLLESRGPKVLPSFAVLPSFPAVVDAASALGADLMSVLHGAQRIEMLRPFSDEAEIRTTAVPEALYDKGKGALLILSTESVDDEGPLCRTEWQLFFRGMGDFGGERGPPSPDVTPPEGPADHVEVQATLPTQALLYRVVSGDKNPLHAEPAVARAFGFDRPILHGLCTLGFATRAIVSQLGGDPERLRTIEARFAKPVLPGDELETRLWLGSGAFETKVGERVVLSRGRWTAAQRRD